jgi:hypothetical protein
VPISAKLLQIGSSLHLGSDSENEKSLSENSERKRRVKRDERRRKGGDTNQPDWVGVGSDRNFFNCFNVLWVSK